MSQGLQRLTRPMIYLVLFNMIPQVHLRPWWVTLLSGLLIGYRLWLDHKGWRMPPRYVLWAGQLSVGLAVWQYYRTFLGDEAGGAYLTLLTCTKIFELNRKRDFFLTTMMCLLVLMSYLLLEQGLMITGFLIVDVLLLVGFLVALEEERWGWNRLKGCLRLSVALGLKSLPLLVLLFVLFPRFNARFGASNKTVAKTGITDMLKPGSVSELVKDDALVFRANFLDGNIPMRSQLYWRGAVLDRSAGLNWTRMRKINRMPGQFEISSPDVEVYLEPGSDRFLFSLDTTKQLTFPNTALSFHVARRAGRTFELTEPLQTRERYYMTRADDGVKEEENPADFLSVEERPSPQLKTWLKKFAGRTPNETVRDLLTHFRSGGYTYSLQPPPVGTLDDFLFKTKTGFCEHFAGTMATILRDLKIPARVVVGFQGGTRSILGDYLSVRGRDAHAWVEYYDTDRWHRVDPTAEVEPQRLVMGSDDYLGKDLMPRWMPAGWLRDYLKSRAVIDEIEASWTGFLLRFDLGRQKELLAKLGMEEVLFRALGVFLLLSGGLILAVLYFVEAQRREPMSVDEKLYRKLLAILRKWGIEKSPAEGPMTLLKKVEAFDPKLAETVKPVLLPLISARFGRESLTASSAENLRRQLRTVRRWSVNG